MYRPNLTAEEARVHALDQVIENFFAGSKDALLAQLNCDGFRALAVAAAVASGGRPARVANADTSEALITAKRLRCFPLN